VPDRPRGGGPAPARELREPGLAVGVFRDGRTQRRDEERAGISDRDVADRGLAGMLQKIEARRRPREAGPLPLDALGELLLLAHEHRADLTGRDLIRDERPDLAQGEAEILEDEDPVQLRDLRPGVGAVSGRPIDLHRPQKTQRGVIAQRLHWNMTKPRELPDAIHASSSETA